MRQLLLLSLFSVSAFCSQVAEKPTRMFASNKGFIVQQGGKLTRVAEHNLDGELRKLNLQQRAALLKKGGVAMKQLHDGEHRLAVNHKLKGGGPVAGAIAYWITKSLCWGGVVTTATVAAGGVVAATVATGGAALGAGAGAVATVTGAATAATGIGIGALGGGAAGAVGATIASGGMLATAAGTSLAGAATVGASLAVPTVGLVAGIEAASLAAATTFSLMPFLP